MRHSIWMFLLAAIGFVGCSPSAEQEEALREREAELSRMQQRLIEVQDAAGRTQLELERELAGLREEYMEESEQQSNLIELLRRQVADLRDVNRALRLKESVQTTALSEPDTSPPVPPLPPQPVLQRLESAAQEASSPVSDFPAEVLEVSGRTVVTGTHSVSRFVENGEVVKDRFGRERPDGEWVQEPVNQYGYEAVFSVRNRLDRPITVTARAGLTSEIIALNPGQTRSGIRLTAARGSALWLLCEGNSRKLDIAYDENDKTGE